MNKVELAAALQEKRGWPKFADKLEEAMREYRLDGITIVIRELTAKEMDEDSDRQVLSFNHDRQQFNFAVGPNEIPPAAWTVADKMDYFLNPQGKPRITASPK